MAGIRTDHELHRRRRSRNVGLGGVLGAFVLLVFAVTIVKLSQGQSEDPRAPNFRAPVAQEEVE